MAHFPSSGLDSDLIHFRIRYDLFPRACHQFEAHDLFMSKVAKTGDTVKGIVVVLLLTACILIGGALAYSRMSKRQYQQSLANQVSRGAEVAKHKFDELLLIKSPHLQTGVASNPLVTPDIEKRLPSGRNEKTMRGGTITGMTTATPVAEMPFRLSASIMSRCRRLGIDCDELHLTKFAEESRDNIWAPLMEENILRLVLSEDSGKYEVRNIECRTTLCALEVASVNGPFFGSIDVNDPVYRLLSSGVQIHAYEIAPDLTKITVTLKMFVRRY